MSMEILRASYRYLCGKDYIADKIIVSLQY